jgi:hypothetical protein
MNEALIRQRIAKESIEKQELESSIRDLETLVASLHVTLAHERSRRATLMRTVKDLAARHAALTIEPTVVSFAELVKLPWLRFQASFTRDDAVQFLQQRPVHTFLTRPSTSGGANSLALSYVSDDEVRTVKHVLLQFSEERQVFFAEQRPDKVSRSLRDLIESFGFTV